MCREHRALFCLGANGKRVLTNFTAAHCYIKPLFYRSKFVIYLYQFAFIIR